jgi:Tfp pilus assembly protein FimT
MVNLLKRRVTYRANWMRGFSMIELMVVVLVAIVLLAIAIPSVLGVTRTFRIAGDIRGIAAEVALARMRAASRGAKARLNFDTTANTYQVELWSTSAGAYQLEGGVQSLSEGVTFGYGSIANPAGLQSSIAQGYPSESGCTCIYFNSRGLATDSSGSPTANSAIYITTAGGRYSAVAVSIAGQPQSYTYNGSAWVAF